MQFSGQIPSESWWGNFSCDVAGFWKSNLRFWYNFHQTRLLVKNFPICVSNSFHSNQMRKVSCDTRQIKKISFSNQRLIRLHMRSNRFVGSIAVQRSRQPASSGCTLLLGSRNQLTQIRLDHFKMLCCTRDSIVVLAVMMIVQICVVLTVVLVVCRYPFDFFI